MRRRSEIEKRQKSGNGMETDEDDGSRSTGTLICRLCLVVDYVWTIHLIYKISIQRWEGIFCIWVVTGFVYIAAVTTK